MRSLPVLQGLKQRPHVCVFVGLAVSTIGLYFAASDTGHDDIIELAEFSDTASQLTKRVNSCVLALQYAPHGDRAELERLDVKLRHWQQCKPGAAWLPSLRSVDVDDSTLRGLVTQQRQLIQEIRNLHTQLSSAAAIFDRNLSQLLDSNKPQHTSKPVVELFTQVKRAGGQVTISGTEDRIQQLNSALDELAAHERLAHYTSVESLLHHGRQLGPLRVELDDLVAQLLRLPMDSATESFRLRYTQVAKKRAYEAGICRILMFVSALGLIAHGVWRFRRNALASAELQCRKENLESELADRTSALEKATLDAETAREDAETVSQQKAEFERRIRHEISSHVPLLLNAFDSARSVTHEHAGLHAAYMAAQDAQEATAHVLGESPDAKEAQQFSVRRLLMDVTQPFAQTIASNGIELVQQVEEGVAPNLVGRESAIRQILKKLLDNAVNFTSSGSVTVGVATTEAADEQPRFRFYVRDTGSGIPERKLARILQAAREPTETIDTKKVGLGLAMCQELLTGLDSEIEANSKKSMGSEFFFNVALEIGDEETTEFTSDAPVEAEAVAQGPTVATQGIRAIVIEDNSINQKITRTKLRKLLCHVTLAESGRVGLDTLDSGPFDIVFMDCDMPVMDGYETTTMIREKETQQGNDRVPIIGIAGKSPDREKCVEVGMDDMLTTPIKDQDLAAIVKKWSAKN